MKIALCGKIKSGKTTVAQELVKLGYRRVSFALHMKETLCRLYGLDLESINRTDYKEQSRMLPITDGIIKEIAKSFGVKLSINKKCCDSIRDLLQTVGIALRHANPDVHIKNTSLEGDCVVDDCRFENELAQLDISFYLERDSSIKSTHESELLSKDKCDYVIDNNRPIHETLKEILSYIRKE